MNEAASKTLAKDVSVKVRVDGSPVAVVKTRKVGFRQAVFPLDDLPLTVDSFVELEFFDGADRLILPARVTAIGKTELTMDYEQTGEIFEHWLNTQIHRS